MDVIPSSPINYCSSVFSEIVARLANLSISEGNFPSKFKLPQFTPLLTKPGFDKDTPGNYWPISNLNNISKMLEHLIHKRLQSHTTSSSNFNPFQSAYRRYFSSESALLHALDNIYHAIDTLSSTVLVSLDLSAAFDTIEHSVLLNR